MIFEPRLKIFCFFYEFDRDRKMIFCIVAENSRWNGINRIMVFEFWLFQILHHHRACCPKFSTKFLSEKHSGKCDENIFCKRLQEKWQIYHHL